MSDAAPESPSASPEPSEPASPESPSASRGPPPSLTTRLIGLAYLLAFGALAVALARRAFAHDFGTENTRLLAVIRLVAIAVPGYPAALGLLALLTGRRPPLKYNPLAIPLEAWWYQTLGTLCWRELKRILTNPVAYIVLAVFLFLNGLFMGPVLEYYAGEMTATQSFQVSAARHVTDNTGLWISLFLVCPAVTMRLVAEEQRDGTLEMLLTAPVTHIQVVLSKFLAALGYVLLLILLTLIYLGVMYQYSEEWDAGPVIAGYLGLVLISSLFVSLGVFCSTLTRNVVVAFILSAGAVFAMLLMGVVQRYLAPPPTLEAVLDSISAMGHAQEFGTGVLQWKVLVYYVSTTVFFLFLAVRGLESHKWR